MARVVAARKRARKRLAAKRKNVVFTRPQVTNSTGPKVTLSRRMLYIVAAIVEAFFFFLSIVADVAKKFFDFLSAFLTVLQVIFEILNKWG